MLLSVTFEHDKLITQANSGKAFMAQVQEDPLLKKKRAEDLTRATESRVIKEADRLAADLLTKDFFKTKIDMSIPLAETILKADLPLLQSASKTTSELDSTLNKLPTLNDTDRTNASKDLLKLGFDLGVVKANIERIFPAISTDSPIEKASRSLSAVKTALDNYQPFSILSPSTWGNVFSESKSLEALKKSWKQFKEDFAPFDELSKSLKPFF